MLRGRIIGLMAVAILLSGVLAAGCQKDSTSPVDNGTPGIENPNLDDPLGGYTAQGEAPAFGDADLNASSESETAINDAIGSDPQIVHWQNTSLDSVRIYAVTLMWGMLDRDPSLGTGSDDTAGDVMDWSGYFELSRGGVLVRSTVSFERDDYVVGPRTDRQKVVWVSHTTTGFDGLRLAVYQPLTGGDDGANDSVTIVAGTHRWDFLVNDLKNMNRTDAVDDLGNKFSIRAFEVIPQVCNRGFLGGAWMAPKNSEDHGTFRGRWVASDGSIAGYMRGIWGVNNDGQKVFYGKYIDLNGDFRGFLRGSWGETGTENGPAQMSRMRSFGWFRGDWVSASGEIQGTLRGQYRAARDGADGFFEGAWAEQGCGTP